MKRIVNAVVCFMLCAGTSYAQEFSSWEFTTSEANRLKAGSEAPIDVTEEKSEKTIIYNHSCLKLPYGDYLSKISFRGYHPGKDLRRHLRVWIKNDDSQFERDIDVDVNKMACVFDGDCTIPGGVSSEDRVSLLDIPLDNPFLYTRESWLVLKIECTGETVDDSVYFEAHEDGAGFTPVAVFTIQSPVVHYSGKVVNQEGRPVENANVRFYSEGLEYKAKSDGQGNFKVRIERGNNRYGYEITADGCADYLDGILGLPVGNDASDLNFMVYDAILFKKDEPATIILPTPPDPTLGRFYRFDRYENEPSGESHYFFERENAPQANVPYVVFPNHLFQFIQRNDEIRRYPFSRPVFSPTIYRNLSGQFSEIRFQIFRLLRRNTVPSREQDVIQTFLGILRVEENILRNGMAVSFIFFLRLLNGGFIPVPKQLHNRSVIHFLLSLRERSFHFYTRKKAR